MATLASNKRARFDFDIKETFDAGLVLEGREVKSAKSGNVSLTGSYVSVSPNGASLINAHIGPYKYAPSDNYEPTKSRKVLLKQKEIDSLLGKEKGLIIVPMEMFTVGRKGLIKLKIGLGKARKKTDKREYLKKKESEKEIRRAK